MHEFHADPATVGAVHCDRGQDVHAVPGVADNNKFAGGDGSDQFVNQVFIANPLMVPQIPLSTFVVGALMPQEWGHVSLSVMDPWNEDQFMDFGTLFNTACLFLDKFKSIRISSACRAQRTGFPADSTRTKTSLI